jgi:hypothetical protein
VDDPALMATIEARVTALGSLREGLALSPGSTIFPDDALAGAALLERVGRGTLDLAETLGEGGMGVVRLGTQRSLGRRVAVKTLREGARDRAAAQKLLREAWVTGSLEHPNILPIHDVQRDADGQPLVILKLIEGVDWASLIHDAEATRERTGEADLFTHNIGVLLQVCRAVAFAHSRGIVHRDIKPENVRIGSFGEVYLLDWGLAVSLRPEDEGTIPLARDATELAGTPAYMAPEMLGGPDMPPIDARTDVYLLGATLYEIVAGRPPHGGATALEIIRQVTLSAPEIPGVTPYELGQVLRRALAADPDERFASADAFREAIEEYLAHRTSFRLADQGDATAAELARLVAAAETPATRVRAYKLFGACMTSYDAALELWQQNLIARDGMRTVQLDMVEYELRRGDGRAARALADEVASLPEEVEEQVARAIAAEEADARRRERLEELDRDHDPDVGRRTRVRIGAAIIAGFGIAPIAAARLVDYVGGYRETLITCLLAAVALVLAGLWARTPLLATAVNRTAFATMIVTMIGQLVILAAGWLGGLPIGVTISLFFLLWMTMSASVTIHFDRRLWPMCAANLIAFLVTSWRPELRHWVMLVSNLVTAGTLLVAWPARVPQR